MAKFKKLRKRKLFEGTRNISAVKAHMRPAGDGINELLLIFNPLK
jgi:hypothetical protein